MINNLSVEFFDVPGPTKKSKGIGFRVLNDSVPIVVQEYHSEFPGFVLMDQDTAAQHAEQVMARLKANNLEAGVS